MRVIIAGSRDFTHADYDIVENACLRSGYWFTTVVSGCADGVDRLGEDFAKKMGIPVDPYPADWNKYGKRAGLIRNVEMAKRAQALVLVWDGKSRGSKHMLETARTLGLLTYVRVAVPTPLLPRLVGSR